MLLTENKSRLLAQILTHPNCKIVELGFDRCRAKAEKMGLILEALARNQTVTNLSFKNMNIARDSLTVMSDMLGANKTLQMLTLFNTGLSENSIQILAQGLE